MPLLENLKTLLNVSKNTMPINFAFFGKNEVHHHYYFNAVSKNDSSGTASSGTGRPAEPGKSPGGAGNRTASGDEESATADGLQT